MRPGLHSATSLAYMEMATPTLADVVQQEYGRGTRRFAIVPLFFAAGRHLLVDVPLQIESLSLGFADIHIDLHEALGKDSTFWDFLVTTLNNK